MKNDLKNLFIGTSGWAYPSWNEVFYPKGISGAKKLEFYSQQFRTVEVNYSFYHLPAVSTYLNWNRSVDSNFLFALKISRYISHIKRLKGIKSALTTFIRRAEKLKENLGPFLLQLPPSFKLSSDSLREVEKFLSYFKKVSPRNALLAIEVRNKSFNVNSFFSLLKKYKIALVISDSSHWQKIEKPDVADFIYLRYHGPAELFSSSYSDDFLKRESLKIKKYLFQKKKVFAYFNNDCCGYAVENAKKLKEFLDDF